VSHRALLARNTEPWRTSFNGSAPDPAPLSARQLWALIASATRELTWGSAAVAREVRHWRRLANQIPVPAIRNDALNAITAKRSHIDGAALFSVLPATRNRSLIRLLVAYEVIWDFLDSVNERSAAAGLASGKQLHIALVDALDPTRPIRDYYYFSPWPDDGGYLRALVTACRANCLQLPSFERVRPYLAREAQRSEVCAINHDLDPQRRDATLEKWVAAEFPSEHDTWWFELTAAASTNLTIFALLALASEPSCSEKALEQTAHAYFPWACALAALLDSYVDQAEDLAHGDHSYVSHYPTPEIATRRICLLIERCLREVAELDNGETHVLIVASMFAMYLSKNSALTPHLRVTTKQIVSAGGSLTRVLYPILRLWRTAHRLRAA
jgi:tetraprenyl-beta-curcumene synthase